jgi:hypothetical protein
MSVYKTRRNIELPTADLEWFETAYPGFSLSAAVTMLLHEFRSIHRDIGATPARIAKDAGKGVKELIGAQD